MAVTSDFECWYDNGFAVAQWKADKKDQLVKDCSLQLTEEKLALINGKANVACPWAGVDIHAAPSNRGNVVLTVTLKGDKGGTAKIVLPNDSPNAWWAELWRVVPSMRPRLERAKPEVLGVVARAEVLLDYLGGYPLYPKKDSGVQVVVDQFGVSVLSLFRKRRFMLLAWKDVTAVSVEGMMDPQRQRSLARTVEFGVLGGVAGKTVKSAYLTVSTAIGEAIFHTAKMTAPELRAKYAAVLPAAEHLIAQQSTRPGPTPATPVAASVADELGKLAQLKAAGVLTEEEFAAEKAKLLSR
jgi:hypothetical protein